MDALLFLESPQNPRVKTWASLKTRKGRQQTGQFLAEGLRLVDELLRSSLEVTALLWDVSADELPDSLREAASERGVPIYELSPNAYRSVSDTVTPQGVMAVAKLPDNSRMERAEFPSHVLLLDGVQDPGNVGTLIRTADAFGIGAVCCGTGTADPYSPKVVRASMGGLFRLPVASVDSSSYIRTWRSKWHGGQVLITAAGAPIACDEVNLRDPALIVIGGEAYGVSKEVAELADQKIRIPMTGMAESLNAAIAGAVILYEVSRQRR
jgi:RNA methyltransferase, TrmH family